MEPMNDFKIIGKGRLQLRQSGKHLVLMSGFKDKAVRIKGEKFLDQEVELYVRVTGKKERVKRASTPRIRYMS
jgi:formylmethanofuran dehydrogenase subunit E